MIRAQVAATALLAALAWVPALACVGCGFTEVHEVRLHEPIAPTGTVEVYMAGQAVPRPFYEVALVQAVGHGGDAEMDTVVKALTRRARELGCDLLANATVDVGYTMAHGFAVSGKYMGGSWAQPYAPAPARPGAGAAGAPPPPPPGPPPPPPALTPSPASP